MTRQDRPLPPRARAISAATGTDFLEWARRIDALGGPGLDHASIARELPQRWEITEWWAQGVTVAYEQWIGRREVGQSCTGEYAASASRTVLGDLDAVAEAWDAFVDEARREELGLGPGRRSATDRWRYWRADVQDGSQVSVNISAAPAGAARATAAGPRSTVAVEHKQLATAAERETWRGAWKAVLSDFVQHLSTRPDAPEETR